MSQLDALATSGARAIPATITTVTPIRSAYLLSIVLSPEVRETRPVAVAFGL